MWTPLVESRALAQKFGIGKVYLKLENCQVTGSFKDRAMKGMLTYLKEQGATGIVCSSGGNAGVACAYTAFKMGLKAKVFIPETTRPLMIERLNLYGAEVYKAGSSWYEADRAAREFLTDPVKGNGWSYAPPFDHPALWNGNAKIIEELDNQMESPADVIICSVGGGGLLGGVLTGLSNLRNSSTLVIGVESEQTNCLEAALKAGKVVDIGTKSTITHSLSSPTISNGVLEMSLQRGDKLKSLIISDREAVETVQLLLDEQRMLIEASCAVSVAALRHLPKVLQKDPNDVSVVVIICGGSAITPAILEEQKRAVGL